MNKDTLKYSTGNMGNTVFTDKLIAKTAEKPIVQEEVVVVAMPSAADIKKIGLELDDETLAEMKKRAQDEKQAADAVGRKLFETRKKIRQIEADNDLRGTSVGETILSALRKDITKLKSIGDEYFQKRAEGFALVEEVRAIDPVHIEKVREMYTRVISLGYRRLVSKKEIDEGRMAKKQLEGPIFFEGRVTVSAFQGEEKNGFYRALEAELRKLTDKAKTSKAAIIANVSLDLNGYTHGKPGVYQFFSPYYKGEDGREYFEGRAVVKLFDINRDRGSRPYIKVEITKATGSLGWAENHPGRRPIPLDWIRNGEIPSDKKEEMNSDQVRYAERVIGNLRRIYGNWKKGLNPETVKPKKKLEGPAVNGVVNIDMKGIIVEAKPVTSSPAEVPKKSTKKIKK